MRKYIRIGVDIAKNSFQVHALESEDCSATKRKLSRSGIVKFLAEVEPCSIGMEACGSAHYWARRFRAMGHDVKLTPPIYVKDPMGVWIATGALGRVRSLNHPLWRRPCKLQLT